MKWILRVKGHGEVEILRELNMPGKVFCLIGRSGADLNVRDEFCSRLHAMLYISNDGSVRIRDLQSHNGTIMSGFRIHDEEVKCEQEIYIGRTSVRVYVFSTQEENGRSWLCPEETLE